MRNSYPKCTALLLLIFFLSFGLNAQDTIKNKSHKEKTEKTDKIKTGWNFGGLPVIAYDSDLGLELGALANIYHYGDGSRYPVYNHSLYFEASWYLKGSGIFRFYYDSDRLIKGIRTSLDLTYMPDRTFKFFGFNGYEAVYNSQWEDESDSTYVSRVFYRLNRKFFRAKLDLQGNIIEKKFRWLAGADFYNIVTGPVDIEHLNKGKSEDKQLPDTMGLYEKYVDWKVINPEEAKGGSFTVFKLGLVFDSRDNEPNPNRGIWTEILLVAAPKVTSSMERGFSKIAITHRQYFTLIKDHLTFAYRLGFQSTIAGYTPWYAQGIMYPSRMNGAYNEGLGGAKDLRGIQRNRLIGDAFFFGNLELRWKVIKFYWIKQNFYIALSGFFDTGRILKKIDIENIVNGLDLTPDEKAMYFDFGAESFHNSLGGGLHIAMNQNFIIAVDYGRALNKQDGVSGLYIGLNFLF